MISRWLLALAFSLVVGSAMAQPRDATGTAPGVFSPANANGCGSQPCYVTTLIPAVCGSAVSNCVLKAAAGTLLDVYAECTSACWLMVFNATALPSNGATTAGTASGNLVECVDIAANTSRSLSFVSAPGETYSVGITVAISSTACSSLTASTVGFVHGRVL